MTVELAAPPAADLDARRAIMTVDLNAVAHNLAVLTEAAAGAAVMAVLKGDGYGLGATVVGPYLERAGVRAFAVDNALEGARLRVAGVGRPILVMYGDEPRAAALAVDHGLLPGIHDADQVAWYDKMLADRGASMPVWIGVSIGMNRAGARESTDFAHFLRVLARAPRLQPVGIYAHLTNTLDESDVSEQQVARFLRRVETARATLGVSLQTSLFATHGLLRWAAQTPTDWVRPGIGLAGTHCFPAALSRRVATADRLRPAVSVRARVVHVTSFRRAHGIGYGQHHVVAAGRTLATVAIGYRAGFPARVHGFAAAVEGVRTPVFGDTGMDSAQLDVTERPGTRVGDWATLVGGSATPLADLATAAGTTPYHLLAGLRLPRRYDG